MKTIIDKQKEWASNKGLLYDKDAYLNCYQSNLFIPLDGDDLDSFENGSGQIKIGDKYYSIENVVSIREK